MSGKVFFSVSMSLDGFIAPESPEELMGQQWMELQQWLFPTRFMRENLQLGAGGEEGLDDDIARETFERTGASVMGKRMFDAGEHAWPEDAPFHTPVFVVTHQQRDPWERPGGTTFHFVNDGIESALDQARAAAGERDVRIAGGGATIVQHVNAGLVDEFSIALSPVLFGTGIRLFEGVDAARVALQPIRTEVSPEGDAPHLRRPAALTACWTDRYNGRYRAAVTDFADADFFRGRDLIADPYGYFDWLRAQCPVHREPHHGVMMVTGYDEAVSIYADTTTFSSCNSPTGPFPGFPVPLEGDDVSALIEAHRHELPFSDQILTFDPPVHTAHRALLMRLITPKRLKENEEFMWRLADRQLDEFVARGTGEFISGYGQPFALLVIADLLGVPEEDHELFREQLGPRQHERSGTLGGTGDKDVLAHSPLEFLYGQFSRYVEERRAQPRDDVLTGLATATFPDGSEPEVIDVARIAANLFAAGQETSVRLFGTALQRLAEDHDLQHRLRSQRELIPNFIEECLRFESPVKGDFRLARTSTTVGGTEIPAGTTVMVVNGAANRDPRKFERPTEFQPERANARQHVAFGHGPHSCPGAPLARAEGRITVERFLDRMSDIRVAEGEHGPPDARRYEYVPTYILRGLTRLHLEWTTSTSGSTGGSTS